MMTTAFIRATPRRMHHMIVINTGRVRFIGP